MIYKKKLVIFSLFFIVFLTSMFFNPSYVDEAKGEELEDVIDGAWKTYDEGSDKFRVSTESIFFIASQSSFFGLIEGKEHTFLCIAEIKAKEYIPIEENSTEPEVESLDDEIEYESKKYYLITSIEEPEVQMGAEEDVWHVSVIYEFKHSTLEATYFHSTVSKRAYIEVKIVYDSYYNIEKYDMGYLLIVDGAYEEAMCVETEENGNYYELKIEL